VRGRQIPSAKFYCLRLLQEMQKPDVDFNRLEAVISQDLSFSFKLLRYVNSALFSHVVPIDSIAQVLMMLGENGVRHWVALAALPELAKNKPGELVTHSLLRASFCERLAKLSIGPESRQGFLMGLFSLLDALIDLPLDEALRQAGVGPVITTALLGTGAEPGVLREIYSLARSYEQCDWPAASATAAKRKIEQSGINQAYSDATLWAQRALHATTRQGNSRREVRMSKNGSLRILWEDDRGAGANLECQAQERLAIWTAVASGA
jgi:EAL and modified HD-GYP domain-containing signal transduction protein